MTDPSPDNTSIAVIGMSGRFPGARSVAELWENLKLGKEAVCDFTDEELRAAGVGDELLGNLNYVKSLPRMDDVELFDPGFFGYSAGQAARIDPQQRLFLECAWEAIEQAGYNVEAYTEPIGVFAGASTSNYHVGVRQDVRSTSDSHQILVDSSPAFMTMRVSYKLDLRGPSVAVQTACSTSLVAVHLACQSLLNLECAMALAGGASIRLPQVTGYLYEEGGILSPDGHCRAFDADAKGTTSGSGVALVLLKRLADAVRDGDAIHAVIRGTAINNDGSRKVGFAAPAFHGQADVLSMALEFAGVEPGEIGLIEAHGTGTVLGDAIELAALTEVFRGGAERGRYCALGSLKTNIGHLDAAAGVAGFIKAVLCLENRALVPSLNFGRPNAGLEAPGSPFYVNTDLRTWWSDGRRRMAGVSSFGIGGTNAHAILEEGPEPPDRPTSDERPISIVPLSARSAAALATACDNLAARLRAAGEASIADIAYTLQVGRKRFRHRRALVAADAAEALAALTRPVGHVASDEQDDRPLVFVFPGAEAPRGAAAALYGGEPAFKDELDRCAGLVMEHAGFDVRAILLAPRGAEPPAADSRLSSSLASFVLEYCLARLWQHLGLAPAAVIGGGAGEVAAACFAGRCSLREGAHRLQAHARDAGKDPRDVAQAHSSAPNVAYVTAGSAGSARPATAAELLRDPRNLFLQTSLTPSIEGTLREADPARALTWVTTYRGGAANDRREWLDALAHLWVRGATVDWSRHHAGERRYRVPLPTYPFERQRCWLHGEDRSDGERPPAAEERLPLEQWFYIPSWRTSLNPPPAVFDAADRAGHWLIFADDGGLGARLRDRLQAEGCSVVTVHAGDEYASPGGSTFAVDPAVPAHHRRLLQELADTGRSPFKVIYCWSVAARPGSIRHERLAEADDAFFHLVRAAASADIASLDILAITNGVYAVAGEDAPFAHMARMTALCKVAAQEAAGWRLTVLDLPPPASAATQVERYGDYSDWILSEARRPPSAPLVAYRGRCRLVQSFDRVELGSNEPPVREIRRGGAYLITGGLGAIGLALATHLARSQPVNLVLWTRGWFPEREGWDDQLARGKPGELLVERIRRLRQLEQVGSRVLIRSLDIADPAAVRAAVEEATSRFGPIRGAFHLAAETKHGSTRKPIAELEGEDFAIQLRPKAHGLRALAGALEDQPLDFGVVFSSNASILGGFGFAAYAAANACVDQMTAALDRSGRAPWIAINWDGWLLAQNPAEGPPPVPPALARYTVDDGEGMAALMRIVAHCTVPQVVVSVADLGQRLRTWTVRGDRQAPDQAAGRTADEETGAGRALPTTDLERAVASIWEDVLGVSRVGTSDDFFALGGDSLTGLRVLVRIRELFQVDIQLETLLESAPTISSLVVEIVSQLAGAQEPQFVQQQLELVEDAVS